jgi:hypothetical protein
MMFDQTSVPQVTAAAVSSQEVSIARIRGGRVLAARCFIESLRVCVRRVREEVRQKVQKFTLCV